MRKLKKISTLLLATLLIVCFLFPTTASAAGTANFTYTPAGSDYTYKKITVSGEGYVTLTTAGYAYAYLVNSKKESISRTTVSDTVSKYAVSSGTYYIKASNSTYNPGTVSYKFTAITQKTNYCKAKAVSLAKSTAVNIYQTPAYHFGRWFKIKTTTSQAITITNPKKMIGSFYVYDSYGKKQTLSESTTTSSYVKKTSKLAAGTYYIYVPSASAYASFTDCSDIIQFKWN